jgi:hypothetical protein
MKKLSKLLLAVVVALGVGFTACNNDDIDSPNVERGNTHVSVTLKMTTGGLRLADGAEDFDENYIGKWGGDDVFESVTIYLVDGSSVSSKTFSVGLDATTDYTVQGTGTSTVTLKPNLSAAFKTTAGSKTVYVVVNETSAVKAWLNKTPVHEFEQAYQNLPLALGNSGTSATVSTSASKVAEVKSNKDAIVMTNLEPKTITVAAGISAQETIDDATKTRASLTVQRAVARVMVTIKEPNGGYKIPDPNTNGATNLGTLSGITWSVAQGENSLFVQQKPEFETPNWGWVPGDGSANFYGQGTDPAVQKYDYSGLFEKEAGSTLGYNGITVPTKTDYATQTPESVGAESLLKGKFVLPTTHLYANAPTGAANYTGGYKKGNTAYVLIRATFTPEAAAFADGGTYTTGDDFYVSENGKFYKSAQAAYDDTKSAKMTKYENGKVLYYAWLNPDQVPNWYNSPALRNNIYHIHITGFRNLGTNWNPLYPEDPSAPGYDPEDPSNPDPKPVPEDVIDPDDPDNPVTPEEPENPIDPEEPLTTSETWMSVDVTVLPWKVHSYEVPLGI